MMLDQHVDFICTGLESAKFLIHAFLNFKGNGPGGGACYGSAGHGGMGIDFERDANEIKYGWRYASDNSNIALIGGSSGQR